MTFKFQLTVFYGASMFEAEDIFFRIDRIQKAFSSLSLESESLSEIFFATKYFLTTMNGRLYQTSKDEDGGVRL